MKAFLKEYALAMIVIAILSLGYSEVQDRDARVAELARNHAQTWDAIEAAADQLTKLPDQHKDRSGK